MSDEELDETASARSNEIKNVSYPLKVVYCPGTITWFYK